MAGKLFIISTTLACVSLHKEDQKIRKRAQEAKKDILGIFAEPFS